MYYEEKIINGVLSFRNDPNDEWTAFTLEEMAKKWEKQKQDFEAKKQAAICALGMAGQKTPKKRNWTSEAE